MNYLSHVLIYLEIYVIVALSLNLVIGYCGMMTLAHAGYFAIGGYTYALLATVAGWDFLPAMIAAILVSCVLSLAVSLPAWRVRGDSFVLASLAVQGTIFGLLNNWNDARAPLGSWANLTNGPFGITGIPGPTFWGHSLPGPSAYLALATSITGVIVLVAWRLQTSPWKRELLALRDDELAFRNLGKNTRVLKVQVLAISAGAVAVAGALYAGYARYLDPTSAALDEGLVMLTMVMVGGTGNFRGPIVGALVFVILPELLRTLNLPGATAAEVRQLLYGALLVLTAHLRPQGISGEYRLK